MAIDHIHWHDSTLRKVVELPAAERLLFEVDYPVNWENGEFSPHIIGFAEVHKYEIHEGPFAGAPTILHAASSGGRPVRDPDHQD